jgi:hypothetical protein
MNIASAGSSAPVRAMVQSSSAEAVEGPETAAVNDHDSDDAGGTSAAPVTAAAKAPAAPGTGALIDKMA